MDLGISGRRAIVCAASKGLGRACAIALANEGVHVTITARGAEALAKTAAHIRKASPNVTVTPGLAFRISSAVFFSASAPRAVSVT